MTEWINHSGRASAAAPMRIVSLVPSLTELLYDLGLDDRVVAITRFCLHPATWQKEKKKIGGTKKLHLEDIRLLQPDLIIANKEENVEDDVLMLSAFAPVMVTDINSYTEALEAILDLGKATETEERAQFLVGQIEDAFSKWQAPVKRMQACYVIWQHPYMVAGNNTYIHSMMQLCGFTNVFESENRYPALSMADIAEADPDFVFLSSEPYPFKHKHLNEWKQELPSARIELVDGEMFSWYGTRLLKVPHYFSQLWQRLLQ